MMMTMVMMMMMMVMMRGCDDDGDDDDDDDDADDDDDDGLYCTVFLLLQLREAQSVYTQAHLYTKPLLHMKACCIHTHAHSDALHAGRSFYTQTRLLKKTFPHNHFCTQHPLNKLAFTHTDALARKLSTKTILHTKPSPHRCFYTEKFERKPLCRF